ncbi:MAG: hypothetical protein R3F31_03715 [Verrucomicrobiales bacterium]
MNGGTNSNTYAQIGHGGANDNSGANTKSGDLIIGQVASATLTGGSNADAFTQIGHGGDENDGDASAITGERRTDPLNGGSNGARERTPMRW